MGDALFKSVVLHRSISWCRPNTWQSMLPIILPRKTRYLVTTNHTPLRSVARKKQIPLSCRHPVHISGTVGRGSTPTYPDGMNAPLAMALCPGLRCCVLSRRAAGIVLSVITIPLRTSCSVFSVFSVFSVLFVLEP